MNERPDIPYPVPLHSVVEPAVLATLRTVELGAVIRLSERSWTQAPPGSLPDDDARLARWAGLTLSEWQEVRPAVLEIFTANAATDGRLHNETLQREHARLVERANRRTAAAKKAASVRHGGGGTDPPPLRLASGKHASRMRVADDSHAGGRPPPTPPSSERSAPKRPSPVPKEKSAPSAPSSGALEGSGFAEGARARALDHRDGVKADIETARTARRQAEVRQILERAEFGVKDQSRRRLPQNVVHDLSVHRNASPQLALYAVGRIKDRCVQDPTTNPIGLAIAAFGAQRKRRGKPWEVPALFIEREWSAYRARVEAGANLQAHVNQLRSQTGRRPSAGSA